MVKLKKRGSIIKRKRAKIMKPAKRRKVLVKKLKTKKIKKFRKSIYQFPPRAKAIRRAGARKGNSKKVVAKKMRKKIRKKVAAKRLVKKSANKRAVRVKKGIYGKIKRVAPNKAKKHIAKKRPNTQRHPVEGFSAEALFKAKIKVIGVGGGGGSIVSEIGRSLEKATFVIADTDIRALKKKSGIKYFWFGEDLTHGLGTGVNVELAKQAAQSAKENISGIFKDQDIIIFVASLGGGLGSGATQIFAEAAREFGGITFGIFTMPFKFEGKNKYRIAQNALKFLRKSLNVSLVIPNEKIFKIIDSSTPITNAFSIVNKSLIESLESLIDLIYNPGVINIDFADLRTILTGRGNSAFLNTIEESGKDRIEKTCENIFKNPLLQNSSFKAEKIMFNIAGSEGLSMFEVEKISSHIADLNPKAKIIFGISKNSKLQNKIKTTILMTGIPAGLRIAEGVPAGKAKSAGKDMVERPKEAVKKEVASVKNAPARERAKRKVKSPGKLPVPTERKPVAPNKAPEKKQENPPSFIPVFEAPAPAVPILEQKRVDIIEAGTGELKSYSGYSSKKTIRRSGLEIKKAEELQEKKKIAQEKEWEIPAFLRKVKFKS